MNLYTSETVFFLACGCFAGHSKTSEAQLATIVVRLLLAERYSRGLTQKYIYLHICNNLSNHLLLNALKDHVKHFPWQKYLEHSFLRNNCGNSLQVPDLEMIKFAKTREDFWDLFFKSQMRFNYLITQLETFFDKNNNNFLHREEAAEYFGGFPAESFTLFGSRTQTLLFTPNINNIYPVDINHKLTQKLPNYWRKIPGPLMKIILNHISNFLIPDLARVVWEYFEE